MPGNVDPLPTYLQRSVGQVIRAWREDRGITLSELARRAGVSRGYLSQVETNRIHTPAAGKVAQLAAALGVDPLVLLMRQFPGEAEAGGRVQSAPSAIDLSRLLSALSGLPLARQQQYIDAVVSLVEKLAAGEPIERH